MQQGLFVTIEGCEGAGKSTQCALLAAALEKQGYPVLLTREPGGTEVSEKIRSILLDPGNSELTPRVELLLYLASRAQLVRQVIEPALTEDKVVISDRFHDSTLAYQGGARGLGVEEVGRVNAFATGGLLPEVTFLLDLPAEQGFSRKQSGEVDRMEGAGLDFHRRVRDSFLESAELDKHRIVVLDALRQADDIAAEIESRVLALLNKKSRQ
ncbi:dTMP kinase [Gemmatimonadota bacterium]